MLGEKQALLSRLLVVAWAGSDLTRRSTILALGEVVLCLWQWEGGRRCYSKSSAGARTPRVT
jgi:hypothetical protein